MRGSFYDLQFITGAYKHNNVSSLKSNYIYFRDIQTCILFKTYADQLFVTVKCHDTIREDKIVIFALPILPITTPPRGGSSFTVRWGFTI